MISGCRPLGLLLLVVACTSGQIGDPSLPYQPAGSTTTAPTGSTGPFKGGASGSSANNGTGSVNEPEPGKPGTSLTVGLAVAKLRKLTVEQYRNSVNDVLGGGITVPTDLEADTAQNGFYAIGASNATISPAAAEKLERAAYNVAAQALAPARRASLVPCTPSGVSDNACARKFVEKVGRKAFRRPLTDAEAARYALVGQQAAEKLSDFHAGLEFALAGLLQSPQFLFRAELGEQDPAQSTRVRYTQYELAARLAYAVWNTTPDDALLTAAEGGKLDAAGLATQADRLLADARARTALDNFHSERLGLTELATLEKDASVIAAVTPELRTALRDDVLRTFAEYSTGDTKDFLDVFDTRVTFVNAALADVYGLTTKPATLTRVELPANTPRLGLVGKPAFLALNAHGSETSPTLRGKYMRERFLCESIAAPPPNVVTVLAEPDPSAPTMRDRLRAHASDPGCAACHTRMDPLGLALEHFDPIGRYRETDDGHKLDTTGDLDGDKFDGAVELAQLLRDDPRSAECVVRQAYRYTLGHVENTNEEAQVAALVERFDAEGHKLQSLFKALIASDAFRYAAKAVTP
ncbi:MAG: hypothetical protein RL701_3970 [Pseudomonadota bacterium]